MTAIAPRVEDRGEDGLFKDDATRRAQAVWAFVLLLAVSVPWTGRSGIEASAVVQFKYPLTAAALLLAYRSRQSGTTWSPATWLMAAYCALSVGGALIGTGSGVSLVRSARLIVVLLATAWIARPLTAQAAIRLYARVAALYCSVTLLAFLVGLNPLDTGRLLGFVPPIHPNNLGALAGLGLLALLADWAAGRRLATVDFLSIPLLASTLVLSGSRGAILAATSGLLVALLLPASRRRGLPIVYCLLLLLTVNSLAGNPLRAVWSRDAEKGTPLVDLTLTGRTKAWAAVIDAPESPAQFLFGRGLGEKSIPVRDRFARVQPIHGAWLSAYFQVGVPGAIALLCALFMARRSSAVAPTSPALVGVYLFLVVHSFFESALNDVSILLPLFLVLVATSDRRHGKVEV
jgi:hypothetical protein